MTDLNTMMANALVSFRERAARHAQAGREERAARQRYIESCGGWTPTQTSYDARIERADRLAGLYGALAAAAGEGVTLATAETTREPELCQDPVYTALQAEAFRHGRVRHELPVEPAPGGVQYR